MTDASHIALSFDRVSKKFRKGELHDSLRDLLPALARRLSGRQRPTGLGKQEFWALRDVSFEIPHGEAFGIIGHNGAGKSTILKLLSGIMKPTEGRMTVQGRLAALIEVGAGFHPDLTGRDNVYLNGAILGMSRRDIARKFDEIVAFSGLEEFIDTPVKRYSSGMFARLGFSVAVHLEPDVLIVDEVLSVGDNLFQRKGLDKMHAVARSGATVVFVSHNLKAVAELCQRCLYLDHGRVAALGLTPEVIQKYLGQGSVRPAADTSSGIRVTAFAVRGAKGPEVRFRSGDRMWVDIEVTAYENATDLAVGLQALADDQTDLFNTSTQRLGQAGISLQAGQRAHITFEVDLHFASGTFHFGTWITRYDVQRMYDKWEIAATIFVSADEDVRGVINLRPRVSIQTEARPAAAAVAQRTQS